MSDANKNIKLGELCTAVNNSSGTRVRGVLSYISEHGAILKNTNMGETYYRASSWKFYGEDPAEEKAISQIDKIITSKYQEIRDLYTDSSRFKAEAIYLLDEIIKGNVEGIKWVGNDD